MQDRVDVAHRLRREAARGVAAATGQEVPVEGVELGRTQPLQLNRTQASDKITPEAFRSLRAGMGLQPDTLPYFRAMPRADRLSLTLDHQRGVGCVGYVRRRIGTGQGMTQTPSVAIPALQRLAAAELFVEQSTVKTHLIHLYSKLG